VLVPAVAFADAQVMDNGKTLTIDCAKDKTASIMGNENTITLTGACDSVSIMGNKNTIALASSTAVKVQGNDNTVAVTGTANVTVNGSRNTLSLPKDAKTSPLTDRGKDNKITRAK
jgi:uncharacterized protein (DUF2345 family)